MGRVRSLLALPADDQLRVLAAAALLASLPAILRLVSFVRVRRALLWGGRQVGRGRRGDPKHARVVSAVGAADSGLPGGRKCLARSLAAEALLRAYGYAPEHRIGVAKEDNGGLKAHSWLELDGDVILGDLDDLSRFDPLPSLDAVERL